MHTGSTLLIWTTPSAGQLRSPFSTPTHSLPVIRTSPCPSLVLTSTFCIPRWSSADFAGGFGTGAGFATARDNSTLACLPEGVTDTWSTAARLIVPGASTRGARARPSSSSAMASTSTAQITSYLCPSVALLYRCSRLRSGPPLRCKLDLELSQFRKVRSPISAEIKDNTPCNKVEATLFMMGTGTLGWLAFTGRSDLKCAHS